MRCRHCGAELNTIFVDLGFAPPSNAYLTVEDLASPELSFPLKVRVCESCWLVQTEDYAKADQLFRSDYAYFSSVSVGWLEHARLYSARMIDELHLTARSYVVEVASNDGYLLKNFVAQGIPCLGIEPTASTAAAAEALGIPVLRRFFGRALAEEMRDEGKQADLLIGNNVLAHVPDINDFAMGLKIALKQNGVVTLEFPHLLNLIEKVQFDTIYHEHYSYLSLGVTKQILENVGLRVFHVEQLPTHGGSLRVYACHARAPYLTTGGVNKVLEAEESCGLFCLRAYEGFQEKAEMVKDRLLCYLINRKQHGDSVAAYGAAAKGNTLLNFAGVKRDMVRCVFDLAPSKQGKFLPGSHIPILSPDEISLKRPKVIIVLPWNLYPEITRQHAYIEQWSGEFIDLKAIVES